MPARYPPPVEPGDTVAVVAPSHAAPEGSLDRGLERLRSFDVEPKVYESATCDTEWLRANPEARTADVNEAFADGNVAGIQANASGTASSPESGNERDVIR